MKNKIHSGIAGKRVLYVEDDTFIREEIGYFLSEYVDTLYIAVDGQDGLNKFMQHQPDIVISDIQMPNMNGLKMAGEILKINPYVPIIIISAFNDSEYLFEAIKLGIKYYETKPLNLKKFMTTLDEVAALQDAMLHLRLSATVFDNTQEAIIVTDAYTKILDVNAAFTRITGFTKEESIGHTPTMLKSGRHDESFYKELWSTLLNDGSWQGNMWNRKKNGRIYPEWLNISTVKDEQGKIKNFIAIFSDITQLKENEKRLEFMAHHDALTALPNRLLLNARLEHSINVCKRLKTYAGICFLDLDNFKNINDGYGHDIGDEVLKEAALRLQSILRSDDTLARIGGDEFIFVFENLQHPNEMSSIAEKLLLKMKEPFEIEGKQFLLGASIGISIYPNDGETVSTLSKNADTAMYVAKNSGKDMYSYYNKEMSTIALERLGMEHALKNALLKDEMLVFYQPKYDIHAHSIIGLEALVRWQHPIEGLLSPDKFIELAEETKLIIPIGAFVFKQACLDAVKWKNEGLLNGRISVNVSGIQIDKSDFIQTIKSIFFETKALPEMIEIELTESTMMQNPEKWITLLGEIRKLGIHISIDDFGTGYSSLNHLRRLPIDILKIDRSFVKDLSMNIEADTITNAIISLAKSMGMKTVAEGVETKEQKDFLHTHGCDLHQGYLYAKPVNATDTYQLLKNKKPLD